jgi:hypothetical protein
MYGEVLYVSELYKGNTWSRLKGREMNSTYKMYLFDSQKLYYEYLPTVNLELIISLQKQSYSAPN